MAAEEVTGTAPGHPRVPGAAVRSLPAAAGGVTLSSACRALLPVGHATRAVGVCVVVRGRQTGA